MMRLAVQLPWHFSLLLVLAPACRSPAAPGDAGTTTSAIAATGSAGAAARPDGRGGRKQGKVVLGTFAVPGAPGRAFQVAIGSCEANECPVLVTLVEDGRALAEQQVGFASSTQEVTRTDAERGWGASDMVETAAVPAWVTGEDATFLATMARPVNLAPGVAGLLIDQVAGFEHLKRTHALLAAVDGQLIKAWSFREGAGWTYSTTAVVALGPDRQGVALFDAFDHSHDSDTEPDTLNTAVLAWDPKSRKADPLRRPGLLRAVVIGPFKSIKAAQHARNRKPGCLEGFYVLPAGQVRSARRDGYVLVRPTAVAAAATALAEKQKGCAPGVRAAVMALP